MYAVSGEMRVIIMQENKDLSEKKNKFLKDMVISNSISAAFQRAGVYCKGLDDNNTDKEKLRKALGEKLYSLGKQYAKKTIGEKEHCQNIKNLADELTGAFSGILKDGRFRIGIAQKALNLYLKYLWCLGEIETPPHCPIDRNIIEKLDLDKNTPKEWTKINTIKEYENLIIKCQEKAGNQITISEWELYEFQKVFHR